MMHAASGASPANVLSILQRLFVRGLAIACLISCATAVCQQISPLQSVAPARVISRKPIDADHLILKNFYYDKQHRVWIRRDASHPYQGQTPGDTGWEFHSAVPVVERPFSGISARQSGATDFKIYSFDYSSMFHFRCYGTNPTGADIGRRFAYLQNSDAWICHHRLNPVTSATGSVTSAASTLLDRNVDAIAWTADDRHIVYCRRVKEGCQLMAYSIADDDYSELLRFPKSDLLPRLGVDQTDGVFLITAETTVRQISLPIAATTAKFDSLDQLPVVYQAKQSAIKSVFQAADQQVHIVETEEGGKQFEVILAAVVDFN